MSLGICFFGIILFGVLWAFSVCRFMSFAKLLEFLASIFSRSCHPSGILMMQILDPLVVSYRCLRLWSLFFIFFLISFSDWIPTINLSSSALALSTVTSFLLVSPYSEFLTLIIEFFSSKLCFLFMSFVSLLRLYLHSFQEYLPLLCSIFIIAALKSLSVNSHVCIIWALMCVDCLFPCELIFLVWYISPTMCPHQGPLFWLLKAELESISWCFSFLCQCSLLGFRLPCI